MRFCEQDKGEKGIWIWVLLKSKREKVSDLIWIDDYWTWEWTWNWKLEWNWKMEWNSDRWTTANAPRLASLQQNLQHNVYCLKCLIIVKIKDQERWDLSNRQQQNSACAKSINIRKIRPFLLWIAFAVYPITLGWRGKQEMARKKWVGHKQVRPIWVGRIFQINSYFLLLLVRSIAQKY